MSGFNNNNTTTSGLEGRASNLDSTNNIDSTNQRNNLEDAYNRHQPVGQLNSDTGFESATQRNNLEDAYNRRQEPLDQLNENRGIAVSGLDDAHTHSTIPATQGIDGLNYSGAPIADTNKVNQDTGAFDASTGGRHTTSSTNNPFDNNNTSSTTDTYGNTAGQGLSSQSNRHAGTGVPPVNTAEHVRRNQAEEAIGRDRSNTEQDSHVADLSTGRSTGINDTSKYTTGSAANTGTATAGAFALAGDHGASHHHKNQGGDLGLDDKTRLNSQIQHDVQNAETQHHDSQQRHAGVPQHEGLLPEHSYHNDRDNVNTTDTTHAHTDNNTGKPSAGEKIKGTVEKIVGKVTGNEEKVVKGEERTQGGRV